MSIYSYSHAMFKILLLHTLVGNCSLADPLCTIKECPVSTISRPPGSHGWFCGPRGYMRCGFLQMKPDSPSCTCPPPMRCFDPYRGDFLSNSSRYFKSGFQSDAQGFPSGYCTGKPCDWKSESRGVDDCRYAYGGLLQTCVRKLVGWGNDREPMGSANSFCLENWGKARCDIANSTAKACPKGWNCVHNLNNGNDTEQGFCSPDTLPWR